MPITFLDKMKQTGADKIFDPAKSYQNALAMKATQTNIKTAELSQESKRIDMTTALIGRVRNKEEYPQALDYMVNTLGFDPKLLPESFATDKDLTDYQNLVGLSRVDMLKLSEGKAANWTYRNKDGSVSNIKGKTLEQVQALIKGMGLEEGSIVPGTLDKEAYAVGQERAAAKKRGEVLETPLKPGEEPDIAETVQQKVADEAAAYEAETGRPATPEMIARFKSKAKLETRKEYANLEAGAGPKAGEGDDKGFAPDSKEYRNPKTGKIKHIDVRDPAMVALAKEAGYEPMGPKTKSYLGEEGKLMAGKYAEFIERADASSQRMTTFQGMDRLLDRFTTGKLAGVEKTIRGYAQAFGIPIDTEGLSASEAFNALAQQLALQSRNQGKGMVLAGQMSDKDVQFLKDMNPQLLNSEAGNRLIIKMKIAIERRNAEVARYAEAYREANSGIFDSGRFQTYLDKKKESGEMATSIFGIPEDAVYGGRDKETNLPFYVKTVNGVEKGYVPNF